VALHTSSAARLVAGQWKFANSKTHNIQGLTALAAGQPLGKLCAFQERR
jgi:hypothetical protein